MPDGPCQIDFCYHKDTGRRRGVQRERAVRTRITSFSIGFSRLLSRVVGGHLRQPILFIMAVRQPLAAFPVRFEIAPAITDETRDRDGCRLRTQNPGTEADRHKSMCAGQFHLRAAPSA